MKAEEWEVLLQEAGPEKVAAEWGRFCSETIRVADCWKTDDLRNNIGDYSSPSQYGKRPWG